MKMTALGPAFAASNSLRMFCSASPTHLLSTWAGLLEKKKATVFMTPDTLKALKEAGAHYERRPVVIDGDVVTADGAEPVERFATLFRDLVQQKRESGRR